MASEDSAETPQAPFWCPWCEAIITLDGEPVTEESGAYWHAYEHRDKGPYAVTVMEAFERLDTVAADPHRNMTPASTDERGQADGE